MLRNNKGVTLVELMITMVIFLFAIIAISQIFTVLLNNFKQQGKIAETNVEGVVGLEMFRRDLAHAGDGLPWVMNGAAYSEAVNETGITWATSLNDSTTSAPPRGIIGLYPHPVVTTFNGSAVLSIKSINVATNDVSHKWTYIHNDSTPPISGNLPNFLKTWIPVNTVPPAALPSPSTASAEDLATTDYIITINPNTSGAGACAGGRNCLQTSANTTGTSGTNGQNFTIRLNSAAFSFNQTGPTYTASDYEPPQSSTVQYIAYGLAPGGASDSCANTNVPRMPFNRADYYIRVPATGMPSRCAAGTGVLYKSTINQCGADAGKHTEMPILDCVADMQVDYWLLDMTVTPHNVLWPPDNGTIMNTLSAADIRDRLAEVRVYIVAQEGQRDASYDGTLPNNALSVMEVSPDGTHSRTVNMPGAPLRDDTNDLSTLVPTYKNYRWKLYTIALKPSSLQ